MKPMIKWAGVLVSPCCDSGRELPLKARNDVVERKSVRRKMYPSGVCSKNCECISWPESIALFPGRNVRFEHFHVSHQILHIEFPHNTITFGFKVLNEYLSPLLARNVVVNMLNRLRHFHF